MSNLGKRIANRIRMTAKSFASDCHFSLYYALLRVATELGGRLGFRKLSERARQRKDQWILRYLQKELQPVLEKYQDHMDRGTYVPDAPIWVCWWTGEDTAPPLVRQCIASIRRNAGSHSVYLITKDNYPDHLEIPGYMLDKVEAGHMGLAHLTDYIRVKLLATYGGLWLDATIFCSQGIPALCFDLPVFTCKGPVRKSDYVSDYRWVTFCLGGHTGNVFYQFLSGAFETYWKKHEYAVDYLFFDHIILAAYENIPAIRKLLDEIPDNNIHRDDLQAAMNAAVPGSAFDSVIQPDTALYKLSWREQYAHITGDGIVTIYAQFVSMEHDA